jgi:predicted unusual protein kinase regulating ubiquinone biosynthesis (AarF/ABC1/UbiB family)
MDTLKLPGFVPEELRQLLRFVPTRGWDALEWRPLLGSLRSISWRYASRSGVRRLADAMQAAVPRVEFGSAPGNALALDELTHAGQRRSVGDRVLHLYFRQWLVEDGLFLDLRPARFSLAPPTLYFKPNGLWIGLRPEFRLGMVDLYRSFYSDDDTAFRAALLRMGMLLPTLSAAAETELLELLRSHFGIDQRAQRFSIDTFKSSFDRLFEFFIAHDYRLHSDFVFAGFCLITLYITLERLDQPHDVRRICGEALLDDAAPAPRAPP